LRPSADPSGLFLRPLAWGGILVAAVGLVSKERRFLLLLLVPALLLEGGAAWLIEGGPAPFLAGACHGLALGLIVRVVAWGLHRDTATCVLGVAMGACLGIQVADGYGVTLLTNLRESGVGPWHLTLLAFYLEGCLAFVTAIVCGLLVGKRPQTETR
jgi:hypothetical protein